MDAYGTRVPLMPGLRGSASLTVSDLDTAVAMGCGDVPVLATPRLVALLEEATVKALAGHIEPGETSVGMRVHIDHLAPTRIGRLVSADALLELVDGRRLTFSASATCDDREIASASITRVVVESGPFLARID